MEKDRSLAILAGAAGLIAGAPLCNAQQQSRPNILWVMAEDMGQDLECYGMEAVKTPVLNRMATEGVQYMNACCSNPISSPSRSAMMTGIHQTIINAHNHRSNRDLPLPTDVKPITSYLREAGYTCILGNSHVTGKGRKTDCNFKHTPVGNWDGVENFGLFDKYDEFTPEDQPFFAQIQLVVTHRGDWWKETTAKSAHPVNPAEVVLPPYMADHPKIREEWASYLDQVERMDYEMGLLLDELKEKGMLDNTVIFFIADNGRCDIKGKGYLYEPGIKIPMIAWGKGIDHAVVTDLVSTLDISATILDLAGAHMPKELSGHPLFKNGTVTSGNDYFYSARDTWDEIVDCSRCISTDRYSYIKNYMPQYGWDRHQIYLDFHRPAVHVMRTLKEQGKLTPEQLLFFEDHKPAEELYDIVADPDQLRNLASDPAYSTVLEQMRGLLKDWQSTHRDCGIEDMNHRKASNGEGLRGWVRKNRPEEWKKLTEGEICDSYQLWSDQMNQKKRKIPTISQRTVSVLDKGWKFSRGDDSAFCEAEYDDSGWKTVRVPHDWAITGPFDMNIDRQKVTVREDGEKREKMRTGRTGALPFVGVGWYRYNLGKPQAGNGRLFRLEFDGAMSHALIFLNGKKIGERPYGYSSFSIDITPYLNKQQNNILAVRLENQPESSRWYPGAGIYREVRLVSLSPIHIPQWGTYVTVDKVKGKSAVVTVKTEIEGKVADDKEVTLTTTLFNPSGKNIAESMTGITTGTAEAVQNFRLKGVTRWDIENPALYYAVSTIRQGDAVADADTTWFGIRTIKFDSKKGFFLNEKHTPIKGVCMHHDLGPLGAAVNERALERQLEILKEMGCNAIRTSHNPPAPQLLDLCDRMGFLVMDEAFDEWRVAKNKNGYSTLFDKWAAIDLADMIRRDRNHPSVVIWSIGNEIRDQLIPEGAQTARMLTDICRKLDPTRPVSAGLNNYKQAIEHGFGKIIDIFGINYRPTVYATVHDEYPEYVILGSETSSTVSSRGKYHLPVKEDSNPQYSDLQCSSYDVEYPGWASTADAEFAALADNKYVAGEFVWTGFDYLGEPTPYNTTYSSRSSFFGIVDLVGMKKDRFYLYQSMWGDKPVLHLLPHWNWQGKEGENIPVHCYTTFNEVELFLNGRSLGRQQKSDKDVLRRFRMVWDNVVYQPGELKAVAYDAKGNIAMTDVVRTAGAPDHMIYSVDRQNIKADGKDISFIEFSVVDKNGNICPTADVRLRFETPEGGLVALCNGDANSLESFYGKSMMTFSGKCMAIVGCKERAGKITLVVKSDGMPPLSVTVKCK